MPDFKYEVDDSFDYLIEEKGNQAVFFRRVSWGGRDAKPEIRKWYVDGTSETPGKGCSFMTEEGPNELVRVMTEVGYGKTDEILENISKRDDFKIAVKKVLGKGIDEVVEECDSVELEEVYDPRSLDLDILDEGEE